MEESHYPTCKLNKSIEVTGLHTAFIRNMEDCYTSQGEFHNFWELALVLEGKLCVATDKSAFTVGKHSMVLHRPMEFHRHFNATGAVSRFAVLSFDAALMPEIPDCVFLLTPRQCDQLSALILRIEETFHKQEDLVIVEPKESNDLIQQEIKSRLELFLSAVISGETMERRSCSVEYERIVSFLGSVVEENLSFSQLCHDLGISRSNVKRIFSTYCQMGVMSYYRQLRMLRAAELLKKGKSVGEVSELLHFSSQSAFSNAFKRVMGTAPSQII